MTTLVGQVKSLSAGAEHTFSKALRSEVRLQEGLGVEGDAHAGATVKHRSRVAANPNQPNLRQVHLVKSELLAELADKGFVIAPGDIGENILTEGLDLHALPLGTRLRLGPDAVVQVTGLRNPCWQLDNFRPGLMQAVLDRDESGSLILKAGIMSIVEVSGKISIGDAIRVELPATPHLKLERV